MVPELMATNAAFTESTKVHLFDTSLYLPHERGATVCASICRGGNELNNRQEERGVCGIQMMTT